MASNPTPEDDDVLCALAEDLADGCHLHEGAIGIKQNTETVIRTAITAVANAKLALSGARHALSREGGLYELLAAADEAGSTVIRNCRLRLVKLLGTTYNDGWAEAGFPAGSTAIPGTRDPRFSLLNALKVYFTAHPAAESADMEATAAICAAAHAALSNARQAVNTGERSVSDLKKAAEAATKTLRKRVRGLIDELGQLIADDDTRYEEFGLNIPANPSAPEPIASLTAVAQGSGKAHLVWPYATRMTGTRIMGRRVGVDNTAHSLGTADGLEKTLEDLAAGQWEFSVISYNDGGDAAASPVVVVTVA